MYFIRWLAGDIYICKRDNNFSIKDLIARTISLEIENPNLKEIKNNFLDRSLVLVYDLDFENSVDYPQISYITKDGQVIFSNFFVVRDSYLSLSSSQVKTVIKELID